MQPRLMENNSLRPSKQLVSMAPRDMANWPWAVKIQAWVS